MTEEHLDPRRWVTLGIIIISLVIVVLDTTVLNVAIPTILRELHTELPTLQWVLTGYSLTFATCLIIGGRLGDVFGARRMFIIGASLFGVGSLLASRAQSVDTLIVGEAIIEGIGASLMMPATLAILSTTFEGAERAKAFAIWGAASGVAVAFGPVVGGFLTTNYSWRWAFRINVIVAPLAVLGAMLFIRRPPKTEHRPRVDVPGALLIGSGTFCVVFAFSEAAIYGWIRPLQDFTVGSLDIWPTSRPFSIVVPMLMLAALLLGAFVVLERHKERTGSDPLFELSQLRFLSFRYGLVTTVVLAMGQLGFLFVLPVLLQDGAQHLSAVETGLWLVPSGVSIAIGAQIGGRLTRVVNTTIVVRIGLATEAVGLLLIAAAVSPSITFLTLLPGLVIFSLGLGFASSQLTNVVLSEIEKQHAGAASGANTTVRRNWRRTRHRRDRHAAEHPDAASCNRRDSQLDARNRCEGTSARSVARVRCGLRAAAVAHPCDRERGRVRRPARVVVRVLRRHLRRTALVPHPPRRPGGAEACPVHRIPRDR